MGERKAGEISAYSMFNENYEKIAGTFGADLYEKMLRKGNKNEKIDSNTIYAGTTQTKTKAQLKSKSRQKNKRKKKQSGANTNHSHPKRMGKNANKACFCGSGLKYKKCCMQQAMDKQREKLTETDEQYYLSSDFGDTDSD